MKKILAILLAAGLILGFVNYNKNKEQQSQQKVDLEVEDTLEKEEDTNENREETQNIESPATSNDTSELEFNDIDTGIDYVKNNDFNDLNEDQKEKIYAIATDAIKQMGYDTSDFTQEDLNSLYNDCQTYMIENNVDADNLSLIDQAKLYNILQSHMKNK